MVGRHRGTTSNVYDDVILLLYIVGGHDLLDESLLVCTPNAMSGPPVDLALEPETSLVPVAEVGYDDRDALTGAQAAGEPLVIRDYHRHDPCMDLWTFQSLKARTPDHTVDVDVGNAMVTKGLTFEQTGLHDYIDSLEQAPPAGEPVRYLQAYHLGAHVPGVYDEIDFPHLEASSWRLIKRIWFGPSGTVTGYHDDLADNQLSQIRGRKLVKLISPAQAQCVYRLDAKYDPNGHPCEVDADNWDKQRHPKFAEAEGLYVVLGPGDSVFMPGGWFHYVRALDASLSVNCLGYTPKQLMVDKVGDQIRRTIHNTVRRRADCTCHMWQDGKRIARV